MKNLRYALIVTIALFVSACNVLEPEPVSIISEANFFKTATDAQTAVLGIYDRYQSDAIDFNGTFAVILHTDETRALSGGNFINYDRLGVNSNTNPVNTYWITLYSMIARANNVLENVPPISDPVLTEAARAEYLGVAQFFRGYSHFELMRRYGKVPIIRETFQGISEPFQPERDELTDIYEFVIQDLTEAKAKLPAGVTNKALVSKWVAAGILAKVYMTRNAPGDLEKALTELNSIINSNEYSLLPGASYRNLFTAGSQNTAESIWEISYRAEIANGGNNLDNRLSRNNRTVIPTNQTIAAFKADSLAAVSNGASPVRYLGSLQIVNRVGGASGSNYRVTKFSKAAFDASSGRDVLPHPNMIVLRLADVILLKAEVLNELGNTTDAIVELNKIRTRANLPATLAVTTPDVRLAIENERYIELAFEGHRYWDLVRTNRMIEVLEEEGRVNPLPTPDQLIWPIPEAQLSQNPNMRPQNPGY